jgi:hypothetical protein
MLNYDNNEPKNPKLKFPYDKHFDYDFLVGFKTTSKTVPVQAQSLQLPTSKMLYMT